MNRLSSNWTDLNGINDTDRMIVLQRLNTFVEQVVQSVLHYSTTMMTYVSGWFKSSRQHAKSQVADETSHTL